MIKRLFDSAVSLAVLCLFSPVMLLVALAIKLTSRGPVIYWSNRVGKDNQLFAMPKFRTMRIGTPAIATHLLGNARSHLTPIGGFLRASSLDELPQLWSILTGRMSFVGPRPALFNQEDLIGLRTASNVHTIVPGLTGWAQINGRDSISIAEKVRLDCEYVQRRSLRFDLYILARTFFGVLFRKDIAH